MIVLVCGGRDYSDYRCVCRVLDSLDRKYGITVIVQGCARGADTLGKRWAIARGKTVLGFPAKWDKHGKAAGHIRNQEMLDVAKPDACVAFPGGRGTADMVRRARAAGLRMKVVDL